MQLVALDFNNNNKKSETKATKYVSRSLNILSLVIDCYHIKVKARVEVTAGTALPAEDMKNLHYGSTITHTYTSYPKLKQCLPTKANLIKLHLITFNVV